MPKAEPKRKRAKPEMTYNAVSIIQPSIKASLFILSKNPRGKSPGRVTAQVTPAVPHLVIAYLYHTFLAIGNGIKILFSSRRRTLGRESISTSDIFSKKTKVQAFSTWMDKKLKTNTRIFFILLMFS